ncbi:MAG: hypothetical protein L3J57_09355 [Desulfuromusa sp.]|nr:hypothetical protein [Desulfuromusa sp.]
MQPVLCLWVKNYFGSTGRPALFQARYPPSNGRTWVKPFSINVSARLALEASLGQVQ